MSQPVQFEDVKVGDELNYLIREHDWSGGQMKITGGYVTKITAQCVYVRRPGAGNGRITANKWREHDPRRVTR